MTLLADDSEKIIEQISRANRIAIVSHMNPDPDAYGATLGLAAVLKATGKEVVAINVDGPSDRYRCIPGIHTVLNHAPAGTWDIVIAVDAASAERLGDSFSSVIMAIAPVTINIDHHISNQLYGSYNYVDAGASSTCEILVTLTQQADWPLLTDAAKAFLAGIYGDTGAFRYSITTRKTFAVAQLLIDAGAVAHEIASDLYGRKRLSAVRLQAHALRTFELLVDGKLAVVFLDQKVFAECGATHEDAEGLVEEMRDIDGVAVSALGYWFGDCWKVSMRSTAAELNVSEVAVSFGGGGHVQAAAFRSRKSLEELQPEIIKKLTNLFA